MHRQGDPLSPYLFIICAETLSALIRAKEREGQIHWCKIARGAPSRSHLFFADNCCLYFKADDDEASSIKQILLDYGEATGQRINYHKSTVSFSRNTTAQVQEVVCSVLGVRHTKTHGTYLGIPSLVGRGRKKALEFVKDRVWHRLHSWNIKKLSRAGKEVLLNCGSSSSKLHNVGIPPPLGVCQDLEKMLNSLVGKQLNWGTRNKLVSLGTIMQTKNCGWSRV